MTPLPDSVRQLLHDAHQRGDVVVLATGVFDLLHEEHVHFLHKAAEHGNVLVVGVESDVRTRQLKGEGRPVVGQDERVKQVAAVKGVSAAFVLPEQFAHERDHRELLAQIKPTVLAVSEHTPHLEEKRALMHEIGGEVRVVLRHNPQVSTTLRLSQSLSQKASPSYDENGLVGGSPSGTK